MLRTGEASDCPSFLYGTISETPAILFASKLVLTCMSEYDMNFD
jgi:hypothetical protein